MEIILVLMEVVFLGYLLLNTIDTWALAWTDKLFRERLKILNKALLVVETILLIFFMFATAIKVSNCCKANLNQVTDSANWD